MTPRKDEHEELNRKLSHHFGQILACTCESERFGRVLLATPPENRYPYVYPRDLSSIVQLLRRVAGSKRGYECADEAFELMRTMAAFLLAAQSEEGCWGQRYGLDGEDKSIYKQEDNLAHGIAVLCNYLLTARRRGVEIENRGAHLEAVNRALGYAARHHYHRELNLFRSTTSIHESSLECGYTCWVNFSFLYAFSLAHEVAKDLDDDGTIDAEHLGFREYFLYTVSELFMFGDRYVRRFDPEGHADLRPDFTLLSSFYYGFLHHERELDRSVRYLESQLTDPELGLIMRYLPFYRDFGVHVHAGNGPWMQYSAILAQYHFWKGNTERGDEILAAIEGYAGEAGEIPEHLSTCRRYEDFMETEWRTGLDYAKEFHEASLLEGISFDTILEETNNMDRSYRETGEKCMVRDPSRREGGYIEFARPLAWSHAEFARALLVRAGDWWKT